MGGRGRSRTGATASPEHAAVHERAAERMAGIGQRYTNSRLALVEAVAAAGRPLTVPEVLACTPELPQSSAYRNLTALVDAGVVRRVRGQDELSRFELDEAVSGHHHHHLVCTTCGTVTDVEVGAAVERALARAADEIGAAHGFAAIAHNLDLVGTCTSCQAGVG